MEEITNLIQEAKNTIDEFERYIFKNHIEKYITVKEFTSQMYSRISYAESQIRLQSVDEDTKSKLESIINDSNSIKEAFQKGNNIEIIINDGHYTTQEVSNQTIPTKFDEFKPIESSAVKITDYDPERDGLSITEEMATPEIIEVPEPAVEMPKVDQLIETANNTPNFEEALDVAAIDAFLNESGIKENIGMQEETPTASQLKL